MAMASEIVVCLSCGKKNRVPPAAPGTPRCGQCKNALPWIASADDTTFGEIVEGATTPVLVDLWAPWCGPCRAVSPALENLARQYAGRFKLVKVNVDEAPATAGRFDAQSIPTMLVIDRGQVCARQVGAASEDALRRWLEAALTSASR
jgi:thioredoxin 2